MESVCKNVKLGETYLLHAFAPGTFHRKRPLIFTTCSLWMKRKMAKVRKNEFSGKAPRQKMEKSYAGNDRSWGHSCHGNTGMPRQLSQHSVTKPSLTQIDKVSGWDKWLEDARRIVIVVLYEANPGIGKKKADMLRTAMDLSDQESAENRRWSG